MINLDGLTLFGPGSEWFWTMAQFVIVAVTLLGIYLQLRLGRSANNFEQANRLREDLQSERTSRNALAICLALKTGAEPGDLPEGPVSDIQDYWENMAGLVRAGHLETDLIRRGFGNQCQWWWVALEPNIRLFRAETGNPRAGEEFEWLAGVLAKEDERAESMRVLDRAFVMSTLDRSIERFQGRVSLAEAMRTGPDPATAGDHPDMDAQSRRALVRQAIVKADSAKGWDWVLPTARDLLRRMVDSGDAPAIDREQLARGLTRLANDKSFREDPLAVEFRRVARDYSA